MAVAVDVVGSAKDSIGATTSLTIPVASVSASATGMGVGIVSGGNPGGGTNISGVTWNGSAMTALSSSLSTLLSTIHAEFYYINSPASGSHNVVVSLTAQISGDIMAGALSVTGGDTTTAMYNGNAANDTGSSPSVTVSGATGELCMDALAYVPDTQSPGTGQTQQWHQTGAISQHGAGSTKAGAASVTMTWSSVTVSCISGGMFKIAGATFNPGLIKATHFSGPGVF